MRVLHCPYNVGGLPGALARAERELGLESRAVVFGQPAGEHLADEVLRPRGSGRLGFELRRWRLLLRAASHYDLLHFNFGKTILPEPPTWIGGNRILSAYGRVLGLHDLRLLRALGKGIVVTFQGDDARQGDVLRARYTRSLATEVPENYPPTGDAVKRRVIGAFARYAHCLLFVNPDLGHVLPPSARFLPYAVVDLRDWRPRELPPRRAPLVVHAPSNRAVKGTPFVLAAVERLKAEGVDFEFELVESLPLAEARRIYERADLGIDQLFAGWYGAFAVELMALGKPVVCFIREGDLGFVPEAMREELPVLRATPESLADVLRSVLADPGRLVKLGQHAREYVERWHDPQEVARTTKGIYEGIGVSI